MAANANANANNGGENLSPGFMKKSGLSESERANSKQIRFHQCYYNPVSCFRR